MLSSACAPGAHHLCHRCYSLCTLRTPQAFTRPVCSWCALLVPPLMQLVHSSHASSLYSTRVLLARTTCTAVDAACALSERLGPLLDPGFLAGKDFPDDATACAVSKRLGPLLDPGFPGRHDLPRRCYSLCSLRMPRAFTRPGFPGRNELSRRCYSLCSDDSTHDIPNSTIL